MADGSSKNVADERLAPPPPAEGAPETDVPGEDRRDDRAAEGIEHRSDEDRDRAEPEGPGAIVRGPRDESRAADRPALRSEIQESRETVEVVPASQAAPRDMIAEGVVLSVGTANPDGSCSLSQSDLAGLTITPPATLTFSGTERITF